MTLKQAIEIILHKEKVSIADKQEAIRQCEIYIKPATDTEDWD